MKALCIYRERPRVAAGASVVLWGFTFTAQENGDLMADIPDYAIDTMEKADRVRRIDEAERAAPAPSADKTLPDMTTAELRAVAKSRGVSIPGNYNKEQIIARLEGKEDVAASQGNLAG